MTLGMSDKLSYGKLAEKIGCSKPTISTAVSELGIRPINGPNRSKLLLPVDQDRIAEWWKERNQKQAAAKEVQPAEIEVYEPTAVVYSSRERDSYMAGAAMVLELFGGYYGACQTGLDEGMIQQSVEDGVALGTARFTAKYGTAHKTEQRLAGDAAKAMGLEQSLDPSKFEQKPKSHETDS